MLKKCLKHEWKACWKNMALLNGAAIFMGALGGFGFLFSQLSELPDLLIVLYLFAYVLIVIAASVMTQVLMIQRYYKNLFYRRRVSDQRPSGIGNGSYSLQNAGFRRMEHLKRTFRSRFLRFFASAVRNPVFYRKHPAFLQQDHDLFRFSVLSLGTDYLCCRCCFFPDRHHEPHQYGTVFHRWLLRFAVLWHSSVLCRHQHRKPGIQPQNSDGCPFLHRHDYRDPDLRRNQHRPCFPGLHTDCCGYHILGFYTYHHRGALRCSVPDLPLYLKQTAESFIKIALKSAAADEPNRLRRRFVCMFCTYARCQISSLYCAMVRSEEKKPAFAMLIRHFLFHASLFS